MPIKTLMVFGAVLLAASSVDANQTSHKHGSAYAGQESRVIKSLSESDIRQLRNGAGWGMAKAAELNGVPGPLHLLELKDEIPLNADQIAAIESLYESMQRQAIKYGEDLIALEQELESHFQARTITDAILAQKLGDIAATRRNLRYTHLSAHLETPDILSEAQIQKYNALRGYSAASPCDAVPSGHNAEMWRKHNGCK